MPKQFSKREPQFTTLQLLRSQLLTRITSIYEKLKAGDHYTVYSWFFKNGEPPVCVQVIE